MFKVSSNWVKEFCGEELTHDEILKILNLQGFEVKSEQTVGEDKIITIEVKANRPDMLSHIGVSREICAFLEKDIPSIPKASVLIDNENFPVKINIESPKICRRYSAVCVNNIDNTVEAPEYIKNYLESLGINTVNAVVDIANYVMLKLGQPLHTYDLDKISGNQIDVLSSKEDMNIVTLGNKEVKVRKDSIIISDKDKALCVAGIIGAENAAVEKKTQNILIESAVFDEVKVRLTSRGMKVSTPSSFRFERGIDSLKTIDILMVYIKLLNEICGGTFCDAVYDYSSETTAQNEINLRASRCNNLLGVNLSRDEIKRCLEKYDFKCTDLDGNTLKVLCPSYRLDVIKEVDIIEEVARIYGYDNIEPRMPNIEAGYNSNKIWFNMDKIRNTLKGLSFNEIITYSFIPSDSMKILGIDKNSRIYSDMALKNPIAPAYALMRPTLVYSLINCLAYNYSRNNTDLALFEIGRTYFEDQHSDTGCREVDTLGIIMSGNRINRGWGIDKDVKYTYYDMLNYLNLIMDQFNIKYSLVKSEYPFFEDGTGVNIIVNGEIAGFFGEIKKSVANKVPNAKLIKSKTFYCEIYLKYIEENCKLLQFESKYPPIRRSYNLICNKGVKALDIINIIKKSSDIIKNAEIMDVYEKGMADNEHAVLFEVNYCSKTETLNSEEIEKIENYFLRELKEKLNVTLKK